MGEPIWEMSLEFEGIRANWMKMQRQEGGGKLGSKGKLRQRGERWQRPREARW